MAPSKLVVLLLLIVMFFASVSCHDIPCPPKVPMPRPPAPKKAPGKCPKDTLKFGVCGSWLGLITETIGAPPSKECCSLVAGLADLEAALCFCTAIKADVLGVLKVDVPIALSLLVNSCGKKVPQGFVCP
ncbi:hypothetical protein MLD38_023818 [Melastoma candidum]|uniref:Uncharacterized protein n=1 Tax=Melastoma candidum TaxID=119954 RepID=A0ACB9NRF6_9MYRT|nr:hypothetical protein MLD38_023818 [Melastoma candidum]